MNGGIPGEREFMSPKGAKTPNPFSSSRGGREDEKSFWGAGQKREFYLSHACSLLPYSRARAVKGFLHPTRRVRKRITSQVTQKNQLACTVGAAFCIFLGRLLLIKKTKVFLASTLFLLFIQ